MPEFARTHAALFDELERQGVFSVDVGRLTKAVFDAQAAMARSDDEQRHEAGRYQRCDACE